MNIMRTLQVEERPSRLALAIAEVGRIDKTIDTLNFIDDESRRRSTLQQLKLTEGRHSLARMCSMASAKNCISAIGRARKIN